MLKKVFILTLIIASIAPGGLYADDGGNTTFADLYEARVKRAKATPDTKDDLALAAELLDAAQQAKELPGLVKLICENAEELARSSADGYEVGVAAMRLLIQVVPEQRPKANERLIKIAEQRSASSDPVKRFEGGDFLLDLLIEDYLGLIEQGNFDAATLQLRRMTPVAKRIGDRREPLITLHLQHIARRQNTFKEVQRLREVLLRDANDTATAARIVSLCILELENVKLAQSVVGQAGDRELEKIVALFGKPAGALSAQEQMEVGMWYVRQSHAVSGPAQAVALRNARKYLTPMVTELDATPERKKAELALSSISKLLATLPDSAELRPWKRTDVMRDGDPLKTMRYTGQWRVLEGALVASGEPNGTGKGSRFHCFRIPTMPDGDYEIRLKFASSSGFELYLRRDHKWGAYVALFDKGIGGFSGVKSDPLVNLIKTPFSGIISDKEYQVRALVQETRIKVHVDGRLVLEHPLDFSKRERLSNSEPPMIAFPGGRGRIMSLEILE